MKGCVTWFVSFVGLITMGMGIIVGLGALGLLRLYCWSPSDLFCWAYLGSLRGIAFVLLLVAIGPILLGLGGYLAKRWGIDTHIEGGGE